MKIMKGMKNMKETPQFSCRETDDGLKTS